jgi:protein gp37
MAQPTKIEWTHSSWNPVTGCSKVSAGCKYCYAERMAKRLQAAGLHRYRNGFKVTLQEDIVDLPMRWRKPRLVFAGSMTDLFHEDIPFDYLLRIFETMQKADWHIFQILTKREDRLAELYKHLPWPENVWMGVTVESSKEVGRMNILRKVPAAVRFVSMEPLLGSIPVFPTDGINWIIVGGESGPNARPIEYRWIVEIRNRCLKNNIPFFFKQWGGINKKKSGSLLDGKYYHEYPPFPERIQQESMVLTP